MSFLQEISEEQLNRDHRSQLLGGTDMYTLMGHGYLEKGETHLDAIMALWERKRGLGTKPKNVNEAMRTGVEQEPVAYSRLVQTLARGQLDAADERYLNARLYEPFRGLRIQEGSGDGYGIGGNMDAPLFDVSGEYVDPVSGAKISGEDYARRYAEEYEKIQMQHAVNRARELDGEEPWPVSEAKYKAPPFAGVIDVKVTQSASVYYDEIYNGLQPRFVVQTHHYQRVLLEESRRRGFGAEHDPELLGVYRFCLENNKRHFHEIDYDPELVQEMQRRIELFTEKCLKQGLPPNSSEIRDEFYVYPVKGTEPAAQLPDRGVEEKFKTLLDKHDKLKERQKFLKESEKQILKDLSMGVLHVNGLEPDEKHGELAGVFVDGKVIEFGRKISNRKVTNEAAINGVLLAAGEARGAIGKIQEALSNASLSADEKLALIEQQAAMLNTARLPDEGAQLEHFQSTQRVEAEDFSVSIKGNKNTRTIYHKLVEERDGEDAEIEVMEAEGLTESPASSEPVAGTASVTGELVEVETEAQVNPKPVEQAAHQEAENQESVSSEPPQVEVGAPAEQALSDEEAALEDELRPPTPVQHQQGEHPRRSVVPGVEVAGAELVSQGEPLSETPLNDNLEPLVNASDPAGIADNLGSINLEGLASKPQANEGTKGPDLLSGVIPEGLANQALPDDLFGDPDGKANRETEAPPGLDVSPF